MVQINEQLNELFDSWQSDAHENGEYDFVYDGLMADDNFSDDDWWGSNLRIAFISKDPYFTNSDELKEGDLDSEDYREYDLLEMSEDHRFWRNILTLAYGLVNTDEDSYPDYSDANDYESREYVANNIPFAFVNIKKQAGDSSVSNKVLRQYARRYEEELKEELREILCPNVIYCCGTSGIVMEEIYDDLDFEKIDDKGYIFYCQDEDILLIAGHHPTARMSNRDIYENAMEAYSDFLEDYDFPND